MAHPPTALRYQPLDIERAAIGLQDDITQSRLALPEYFKKHANMCSRLLITNVLEYVSTIPENVERLAYTYRSERNTQQSFYAGSVLALRAVLLSPAALIALRAGWRDMEPAVEGNFTERAEELQARGGLIGERAHSGLNQADAIHYDLFDWSNDLTGSSESAAHFRQGFGYTLRTLELAASARIEAEFDRLLEPSFATPGGES